MPTNQAEFYRGLERAKEALNARQQLARGEPPAARAKAVHDAIQPLLTDTPGARRLACRRGCSHCCHYPVGVSFIESVRLAEAVRGRPELQRQLQDAGDAASGVSWDDLVGTACPLLVDDSCAVHDERPMPCRALGSLDASACAEALTSENAPPRDETAWWRGLGAAHAMADGQPSGVRELRAAVLAILARPDSPQDGFRQARVAPGS